MRPPVVILGGAVTVEDAAPCVRLVVSGETHQAWDMTPADAVEIASRLLMAASAASARGADPL